MTRTPRQHYGRARRARPVRARRGFTLLETLIAVTLTLVLMGAVYLALDLQRKYSIAGQDEIRRLQLIRAVCSRIERDLRSVLYRPEPAPVDEADPLASGASASSASGSSSTGSASDSTTTMVAPLDQESTSTTGLFGNATTLMIHVSRPSLGLTSGGVEGVDMGAATSDLQTISYFMAQPGTDGLAGTLTGSGLARLAGDRMALNLADDQSNVAALAGVSDVLAPEIADVQFRYFDGQVWREDWDSVALAGLPFAVEVTLTLAPEIAAGDGANAAASTNAASAASLPAAATTFRTVINLPVASLPEVES